MRKWNMRLHILAVFFFSFAVACGGNDEPVGTGANTTGSSGAAGRGATGGAGGASTQATGGGGGAGPAGASGTGGSVDIDAGRYDGAIDAMIDAAGDGQVACPPA